MNRFDKDRALTVLMFTTRKNNGMPWDDNLHSLRGLEEIISQRKNVKSRREKLKSHMEAVLREQERLKSPAGREELETAALAIGKRPENLYCELLRGVSCSISKSDKQRALGLGQKDEKFNLCRTGSARRLLEKFKTRLHRCANTSTRSLNVCSDSDDDPK